jgi:hypothetical protein
MLPPFISKICRVVHVGIVGAPRRCLPLPYPGHLSSYPITPPRFPFFSCKSQSSYPHMIISHAPHRLWRSSGNCAFILVLSSSFSRVPRASHLLSTLHYPLLLRSTLFYNHSHTHPSFVVFSVSSGSSTVRNLWISSRRSLRGICAVPARNVLLVCTAL